MRKVILACVIAVASSTAMAQVTAGMLLTVGEWLVSHSQKLYYIEVESSGPTLDAARTEGFKLAVEDAIGSLILTETESQNWHLLRNQVTMYASGYVDRYEIVERKATQNSTNIRMRVWVAHSGIANRLLNQSRDAGAIEGTRISAQVNTLTRQRNSGDQVLSTVMADYPHRAFNIKLEPTQVLLDNQRRAQLHIPFVVEWNKNYLSALGETLKIISHYPECNPVLDNCTSAPSRIELRVNHVMRNPIARFNDEAAWKIMFDNMVMSRPHYRVILHADTGRRTYMCYPAAELDESQYRSQYFANVGPGRVLINGLYTTRVVLALPLDPEKTASLTHATVDVVRQSQCFNL